MSRSYIAYVFWASWPRNSSNFDCWISFNSSYYSSSTYPWLLCWPWTYWTLTKLLYGWLARNYWRRNSSSKDLQLNLHFSDSLSSSFQTFIFSSDWTRSLVMFQSVQTAQSSRWRHWAVQPRLINLKTLRRCLDSGNLNLVDLSRLMIRLAHSGWIFFEIFYLLSFLIICEYFWFLRTRKPWSAQISKLLQVYWLLPFYILLTID